MIHRDAEHRRAVTTFTNRQIHLIFLLYIYYIGEKSRSLYSHLIRINY